MDGERQTVSFQQSTEYWETRATRRYKAGDIRGAALLYRKAARQSARGTEQSYRYAWILRQLNCYEASNRELFAAFALDPSNYAMLGIIAENYCDMGDRQAASDVYSLFITMGRADKPDFDPWDYTEMLDDSFDERPGRKARLNGLVMIASRRIAAGDMEGARRALLRSYSPPFGASEPMRDVLLAEWARMAGDNAKAEECARQAIRMAPKSTVVNALAFSVLRELKPAPRDAINLALLQAVMAVENTRDEIGVCEALKDAGALRLMAGMLKRRLKESPDSLVTCYNMAACMALRGRAAAASRYAHICRELDPDDPYAEVLLERVERWKSSRRGAGRAALGGLSPYGFMSDESAAALASRLMLSCGGDSAGLAARIAEDDSARMRYLLLLAKSAPLPGLREICAGTDRARAEALCREALTIAPDGSASREALMLLCEMGARPPYVMLTGTRVLAADPDGSPPPVASFVQRRLTRVINKAERYAYSPDFIVNALKTVRRMSREQRLKLLGNADGDWALALAMRVARENGMFPPLIEPLEKLTPKRLKRLRSHCAVLRPQ